MDFSGSEMLIVLLVIVVLFGSTRLPKLARSLGEAQREFRRGLSHAHDDDQSQTAPTAMTTTPAVPIPTAPTPPAPTPVAPVAAPTVVAPDVPQVVPAPSPATDNGGS